MPKNMIVRLGVDASDFKKKMAQAGVTARSTSQAIKKSLSFEQKENLAAQLKEKQSIVAEIYRATEQHDIDLSRPLSKQIEDAEKSYHGFANAAEEVKQKLRDIRASTSQTNRSSRILSLQQELKTLSDAASEAYIEMDGLKKIAANIGDDNLQFASHTELKRLQVEISQIEAALREADDPLENFVQLFQNAGTSGRKLSIVPGFLRRIGDSADSSNSRMEKMVRSIRNISVVSLGLRLVRGLFGELGTIIRQHVSQDAALQAQVDTLKASFGQSLAPAINIATNALSAMMPYIIGVSNAISTLISALAGPGWTTVASGANAAAKAIGGAGGAQKEFNRSLQGFDEITKLDSKSSGGGGGGGSTTAATPMEGRLPEWMTGIVDQLSEAISQGDWAKVGSTLATGFSNMVKNIDWAQGFRSVGSFFGGVGAMIWGAVSDSLEKHWDWLGRKTEEFGGNIWMGIGAGIGSAIRGIGSWLKENFLNPMVEGFKSTFKIHSPSTHPEITGIGKNIMLGILNGILEPWKDPVGWIKENIFNPLVSAFGGSDSSPKASIDVQANLTTWKDKLKNKAVNFQSNLTTWKDGLKNKAVNFQTNLTTWKDKLQGKAVDFQTNLTTWKDKLQGKAVDFQTNLTTWKDELKNKYIPFTARFTETEESLTPEKKTIQTISKFATVEDGLSSSLKTFDTTANFHKVLDGLSDSDKTLSVKALVQKGWSGSLASHLGISEITTTLKIKTPTVTVTWDKSVSPNGRGEVGKPNYTVKYNALGAIFTSASLLGRVGNDWQVAGEAGREVLLNVDRHTWWMDAIADRVEARIGGNPVGGDRPIQVNLVVDGKVLANTVVRNVNAQARATGKNPLAAYI